MDRSSLLPYLPFLYLLFYLALVVWTNFSTFTRPFDPQQAQERYFNSAYIKGDKADYILSDAQLYTTEGYFLICQGRDLKNLTPGHPPLGKYLIGLSIKFFNNPHWFNLAASLASLLLLFYLARRFFSYWLSFITMIIFSLEPLFLDQIPKTMLGVYLLFFSLLSLYLYLLWLKKDRLIFILLSQVFLGLALSSKFPVTSLPLVAALLLTTLLTGNFTRFLQHLIVLPALGLAFLLGHFSFFLHHPSLLDFAAYQRFILNWWVGSPQVAPGQVWDLIFRNRWHTWWGQGIVSVSSWWPVWPAVFTLGLLSLPWQKLKNRFQFQTLPLYLWLVLSLLMFSFEAVYPRHLLIVLPAAYLLALNFFSIIKTV